MSKLCEGESTLNILLEGPILLNLFCVSPIWHQGDILESCGENYT